MEEEVCGLNQLLLVVLIEIKRMLFDLVYVGMNVMGYVARYRCQ